MSSRKTGSSGPAQVPSLSAPFSFVPVPGKHNLSLFYPPPLDEPFPKCQGFSLGVEGGSWVLSLLRVAPKPRPKGSYLPHPHPVHPSEKA